MSKLYKLTVLGDLMCEPAVLEEARNGDTYDFHPMLSPLQSLLAEADYVIMNLETPLAGPEAGYTDMLASFNAPDSLADALKDIGVDFVTTANNHSLDRKLEGLKRTLKVLDEKGLAHTGTYADPKEVNRAGMFSLGGTKVAVMNATYGTNPSINKVHLEESERRHVNYLRNVDAPGFVPRLPQVYYDAKEFVENLAGRKLAWEENVTFKKILGIPRDYQDNKMDPAWDSYLQELVPDYEKARSQADLVLFYPHIGGQFNTEPGIYSSHVIDWALKLGFDGIIAAHSHTTQKAEMKGTVPIFYSLGNVTMSPNSIYSVTESLPSYGIAAHLYIRDRRIEKTGFSLFKIVQTGTRPLQVIPVDTLYESLTEENEKQQLVEDVNAVLVRIKNAAEGIRHEYELEESGMVLM